ncbi:MAG: hypothetical protein HFI63_07475 [Lachnospiraceae bacterium]|nr:hypothetical protein [Lachnospiraceae bacterium]
MRQTIHTTLRSVGVFRHYCGYPHFILSVTIAAKDPERLQNIRKEIYLPVAKSCHTDLTNVEKNIRTIRDVMMRNGGASLLEEMTGNTCWKSRTPYPKEIIGVFAEYFSDELKKQESSCSP